MEANLFESILKHSLKQKISIRALELIRKKYPNLTINFYKLANMDYVFYDKIVVSISEDKTIEIPEILTEYNYLYENELSQEIFNIVNKLINKEE
jgi:hypothetical protein